MATAAIYSLPPAALYDAVRKCMVSGVTAGATKASGQSGQRLLAATATSSRPGSSPPARWSSTRQGLALELDRIRG